jgi:hypothetical protein
METRPELRGASRRANAPLQKELTPSSLSSRRAGWFGRPQDFVRALADRTGLSVEATEIWKEHRSFSRKWLDKLKTHFRVEVGLEVGDRFATQSGYSTSSGSCAVRTELVRTLFAPSRHLRMNDRTQRVPSTLAGAGELKVCGIHVSEGKTKYAEIVTDDFSKRKLEGGRNFFGA